MEITLACDTNSTTPLSTRVSCMSQVYCKHSGSSDRNQTVFHHIPYSGKFTLVQNLAQCLQAVQKTFSFLESNGQRLSRSQHFSKFLAWFVFFIFAVANQSTKIVKVCTQQKFPAIHVQNTAISGIGHHIDRCTNAVHIKWCSAGSSL